MAVRCMMITTRDEGSLVLETSMVAPPVEGDYVLWQVGGGGPRPTSFNLQNLYAKVTKRALSWDAWGAFIILMVTWEGEFPPYQELVERGGTPMDLDTPWRGQGTTLLH
jgi:hypothetical protein